jgi:hypothetical protein
MQFRRERAKNKTRPDKFFPMLSVDFEFNGGGTGDFETADELKISQLAEEA